MPTIRTITSEIQTDINANNVDEWFSKRYIYNKLVDAAKKVIKQENASKLYSQSSLFVTVPCVQMITVPLVDCCNVAIPSCKTVQRSKLEFPKIYETTGNRYLLTVRDILNTRSYTATTPLQYQSLVLLKDQDPNIRYFWFENNYLIIPDSEVEVVVITGSFPEPDKAKNLNSCVKQTKGSCSNILDTEFNCPDYLLTDVKALTLQSIMQGISRRVVEDQKPNLNTNDR